MYPVFTSKKLLLCLVLSAASLVLNGQKAYLCMTHAESGKALLFDKGDYIYLGYNGYLGQPEGLAGYILQLDSTGIVLGRTMGAKSRLKTIAVDDISGIRKLSQMLELAKAGAVLTASLVTYSVAGNAGAGRYLALSTSVASAWGVQCAGNALFPSKRPKYKIADGWAFSIVVI